MKTPKNDIIIELEQTIKQLSEHIKTMLSIVIRLHLKDTDTPIVVDREKLEIITPQTRNIQKLNTVLKELLKTIQSKNLILDTLEQTLITQNIPYIIK